MTMPPAIHLFFEHCRNLQPVRDKNTVRQAILLRQDSLGLGDDTEVLLLGMQCAGLIEMMSPVEFDQHLRRRMSVRRATDPAHATNNETSA